MPVSPPSTMLPKAWKIDWMQETASPSSSSAQK